ARIVLIEAGSRILPQFPESLSEKATQELSTFGVEVRLSERVEEIDARGVVMNGQRIATKNVIWAAGVSPSPASHWLGAKTDAHGRLLVTERCEVVGHKGIFAIGDTACFQQDGAPLPGVAPVAMQQGRYVGDHILRLVRHERTERPFRY